MHKKTRGCWSITYDTSYIFKYINLFCYNPETTDSSMKVICAAANKIGNTNKCLHSGKKTMTKAVAECSI